MNVACPQCTSVFRVDPVKVPPGGVRARCSVCSGVINVPEPAFEEPVASGSGGWGSATSPAWGRVATPEGGWTPPPPITPARPASPPATPQPQAAPPRQAAPPPAPFIPPTPPSPLSRAAAPLSPAEEPPADDWGYAPPEQSQSEAWGRGAEPEPPAAPTDWGTTPAGSAANWGDWRGSAETGAADIAPASTGGPVDPWGTTAGNALAPEVAEQAAAVPQEPAAGHESAEDVTPPYHSAEVQTDESATPARGTPSPYEPVATPGSYEAIATPAPPPPPAETHAAASAQHVNPFMRRDPHERARRLARALASDIVTYYPDKHAEGLRDGTLRDLFREEIKKSYDDYVAHVGADLAQATTYFQDALNEVLAGGKRLF